MPVAELASRGPRIARRATRSSSSTRACSTPLAAAPARRSPTSTSGSKPGRADNEMTRFRYDVVLQKAAARAGADRRRPHARRSTRISVGAVRDALADEPAVLRVTGLRNDRLVREAELWCASSADDGPAARSADVRSGAAPRRRRRSSRRPRRGSTTATTSTATWSAAGLDRFDVVLRSTTAPVAPARARRRRTPCRGRPTRTSRPARDATTLGPGAAGAPALDAARLHGADGVRRCSTPCRGRRTARSTATRCRRPTAAGSRTPRRSSAPTSDLEVDHRRRLAGHPRRSTPWGWRRTCSTSAPTR